MQWLERLLVRRWRRIFLAKAENLSRFLIKRHLAVLAGDVERLFEDVQFIKRRLATYLGGGIALTWLPDESPIFVNSNDYGGPMNLIAGGIYEQDNLDLLFSYLKPGAVCLDVGANLGFFSLELASRLKARGRVLAFEPHPFLCDLMRRTIFINDIADRVAVYEFGLSDRDGAADFYYPHAHLGGGGLGADSQAASTVQSAVHRLDTVLPPGTAVDLVKIDVEGHELDVLRGMPRTIADSPDIVILFEKLDRNTGSEGPSEAFLAGLGLQLFGVGQGARLVRVGGDTFAGWSGYLLASRESSLGSLDRARFSIYPEQLFVPRVTSRDAGGLLAAAATAMDREVLFHGPYWLLRRGVWRLRIHGQVAGRLEITIAERYGRAFAVFPWDAASTHHDFIVDHDLIHFECVARAATAGASVKFDTLEFQRIA
jgi:FkbM family methyltransferase